MTLKEFQKFVPWNTLRDMVSTYPKQERQMWLLEFPAFFLKIRKTYVQNNLSTYYNFFLEKCIRYERDKDVILKKKNIFVTSENCTYIMGEL